MAKRKPQSARKTTQVPVEPKSDLGTPELRAKGMAEVFYSTDPLTKQTVKRARVQVQIRIDYLRVLKLITHRQFEAGNRLRCDLHIAGLSPRITVNLAAALSSGGKGEMSDICVAARQRVRHAMDALDASQREVVLWVVFWDMSLGAIGVKRGAKSKRQSIRVGSDLVHDGLTALAKHYGLPEE